MARRFVVDTSVVMAWCFKDEGTPYADRVLESLTAASALVPPIWPLEVVNVLLAAERRKRLTEADSLRFITLLNQLPIRVELPSSTESLMIRILPMARKYGLSSYDASYLDLAMRNGLPLATLDKKLQAAATKAKVFMWARKQQQFSRKQLRE
jgi:predicted nucleic acid-binding protein